LLEKLICFRVEQRMFSKAAVSCFWAHLVYYLSYVYGVTECTRPKWSWRWSIFTAMESFIAISSLTSQHI